MPRAWPSARRSPPGSSTCPTRRRRYASSTGVWTVGGLASGASATLQIVGRFTASSPLAVTAEVSASSLPDPDSTPGNGIATEDDQRTVQLTPAIADLSVDSDGEHVDAGRQLERDPHDLARQRRPGQRLGGHGAAFRCPPA